MAIQINWSHEASESFQQNVDYLNAEWGDREIAQFIFQTQQTIKRLQLFPESYPPGNKSKKYRKARLNKHIVLFYSYHKTKQAITLLSFWNVKQDPEKLKLNP